MHGDDAFPLPVSVSPRLPVGVPGWPAGELTIRCWADANQFGSPCSTPVGAEGVGLCPEHHLEILGRA